MTELSATRQRYVAVNGAWPEAVPTPTPEEAIAGCRLLLREGFRFYGLTAHVKRKRTFKITSGNRHTWPRRGTWKVNPRNWHNIVHAVSHWCFSSRYPSRTGVRPHDPGHAAIEKHLIEYVINQGWLDGKLKRPKKEKPKTDPKADRAARVVLSIKRWETKKKRAETALKKLRKQQRYYDRKLAA